MSELKENGIKLNDIITAFIASIKNDTTKINELITAGKLDKQYKDLKGIKLVTKLGYNGIGKTVERKDLLEDGRKTFDLPKTKEEIKEKALEGIKEKQNEKIDTIRSNVKCGEEIEDAINRILKSEIDKKTKVEIIELLKESKEPEKLVDAIQEMKANDNDRKTIENAYKATITNRIMDLIKKKDIETILQLLLSNKHDAALKAGFEKYSNKKYSNEVLKAVTDLNTKICNERQINNENEKPITIDEEIAKFKEEMQEEMKGNKQNTIQKNEISAIAIG